MSKSWQVAKKNEHYYKSAKKENYRSRASYKLIQLNKKFKLIKDGYNVVDLGAAPGGWSQVALNLVGEDGKVIGVDLQRIKPFDDPNFIGIRGDFTTIPIQDEILSKTNDRIDIIISDAAPSLTGIKDIDQLNTLDLANNVMKIASNILKPKGNLVMKSFQGPQYPRLLKKLNGEFKIVRTYKPESSRNASAEMFIIGLGYKNKKWIDLEL